MCGRGRGQRRVVREGDRGVWEGKGTEEGGKGGRQRRVGGKGDRNGRERRKIDGRIVKNKIEVFHSLSPRICFHIGLYCFHISERFSSICIW